MTKKEAELIAEIFGKIRIKLKCENPIQYEISFNQNNANDTVANLVILDRIAVKKIYGEI